MYKKELKIVQLLNKIYMPNENFRQITDEDFVASDIVNNTIALVSQLHE